MIKSWEYVAGFWDGEGCIWMTAGKGRTASASISQTNPKVLHEIKNFLESQGLKPKLRVQSGKSKKSFSKKDHWTILFQGSVNTSALLLKLLPYLNTEKKTQAQDILRFFKMYPPQRKTRKK